MYIDNNVVKGIAISPTSALFINFGITNPCVGYCCVAHFYAYNSLVKWDAPKAQCVVRFRLARPLPGRYELGKA